jgi:hypothetical protein
VTYGAHPIPDHAELKPCPFCGRQASVSAHEAAPDQPVRYQVGCWVEDDGSWGIAFWTDCFGPLSDYSEDLDELVRLWNRRAK